MEGIDSSYVEKEVLPFLSKEARADVQCIAMQYFLGLTGSSEGCRFIAANDKYLSAIVNLLDTQQPAIAKDAHLALVNLTADEIISWKILNLANHSHDLIFRFIEYILNKDSVHADFVCMILSNLSRLEKCSKRIIEVVSSNSEEIGFDKIIFAFCQENYNPNANLHYLGPFFSNLTQLREMRKYVLDKERLVIQRLIPFTEYKESLVRRGGIIGTIKNCCFEKDYHEWLIGDDVDILPRLLLPLAGPEEFDEEDNEKLPVDLQYLEPDKQREEDPDMRKMLVEAIYQLCAQKNVRQYVKDKNTYVILRELFHWETDPANKVMEEKLISLLISDEPEAGMEDLSAVEIPEDMRKKFEKMDEDTEKEIAEEMEKLKQGSAEGGEG